jgi:hypothetical protein
MIGRVGPVEATHTLYKARRVRKVAAAAARSRNRAPSAADGLLLW